MYIRSNLQVKKGAWENIMNYGKKGVRKKQQALHAKSTKWAKKIGFTFIQVCLIAMVGVGIIGLSAGIGMLRGVFGHRSRYWQYRRYPLRFLYFRLRH